MKHPKISYLIGLVVLLLSFAGPSLNAKESSKQQAKDKIFSDLGIADSIQAETDSQKTKLIEYLTGLSGVQSLSTSIESFLPDFQLASLLGEGDAFGGNDQVNVDFSFLLPDSSTQDHNAKLKAVINRNAELSKDLATEFGETAATLLSTQVDSIDDIEVAFSFNVSNKRFGRSPGEHNDLFQSLAREAVYSEIDEYYDYDANLAEIFFRLADEFEGELDLTGDGIDGIDTSMLSQQRLSVFREITQQLTDVDEVAQNHFRLAVKRADLARFNELVSNQPQLLFSIKHRSRDDLVGPDELAISIKYEMGLTNINSLRKSTCGNANLKDCRIGLNSFISKFEDPKFLAGLNASNRLFASLEYSDISDHFFTFNDFTFRKRGGERLTGELGYGRSLIRNAEMTSTLRMDFGFKFEEFLGSTEGNDRLLASLTLTKKLSSGVSIPLTFEYANKSEFLSDETRQFGGHIGVKWDFDGLN